MSIRSFRLNSVSHFLHRILKLHNISVIIAFVNSVYRAPHINIRIQPHRQHFMYQFPEPPVTDHDCSQPCQEVHSLELHHGSTVISIGFHECTSVNVATSKIFIKHTVLFSFLELSVDFYFLNAPELSPEISPIN